jgi:hypothetical protein
MSNFIIGLLAWLLLSLPFLLLAYALFMFSENKEYKYAAIYKKAALVGVIGLVLVAILGYTPYASYRIDRDWKTLMNGSYTDNRTGINVTINSISPVDAYGLPTFSDGSIMINKPNDPGKSFSAGYKLERPANDKDDIGTMGKLRFYLSGKKIQFSNWKLDLRKPVSSLNPGTANPSPSSKNKKPVQTKPQAPDYYTVSVTEKEIILTPSDDPSGVLHLPRN